MRRQSSQRRRSRVASLKPRDGARNGAPSLGNPRSAAGCAVATADFLRRADGDWPNARIRCSMTIARLFAQAPLPPLLFAPSARRRARADALDDTLSQAFTTTNSRRLEKAVGRLAASGDATAHAILEALADNRLFIDTRSTHDLFYKTPPAISSMPRPGEGRELSRRAQEGAHQQCASRSAIDAALGSLTLQSPDPAKRLDAAEAVFKSRDPQRSPASRRRSPRRPIRRAKQALRAGAGGDRRRQLRSPDR